MIVPSRDPAQTDAPMRVWRRGELSACPRCDGQTYDRGACGLCDNTGWLDENGDAALRYSWSLTTWAIERVDAIHILAQDFAVPEDGDEEWEAATAHATELIDATPRPEKPSGIPAAIARAQGEPWFPASAWAAAARQRGAA